VADKVDEAIKATETVEFPAWDVTIELDPAPDGSPRGAKASIPQDLTAHGLYRIQKAMSRLYEMAEQERMKQSNSRLIVPEKPKLVRLDG
jgi:hypothetical protein